jgi:preprotein translocase subunit SecE
MKIQAPDIQSIGPAKYLKETRIELKKVTWPTKQETVKLTTVVIAMSSIVALFIGGLDIMFLRITSLLFNK